jgi:hypothetical protein
VNTQEGGFALAGTSDSGKGLDKKEESKGGSDIWMIRINEFGDELWQKKISGNSDEETRAVIQITDFGFFVAGNVTLQEPQGSKGYGSKDVLIVNPTLIMCNKKYQKRLNKNYNYLLISIT